jgi:phage regulator Rha-like protein
MPNVSEQSTDITTAIHIVRGQRVLLDSDLAVIYGVTTKRLNEQVRRNADRFPDDFLLRLTNHDVAALRSHFATLNARRGAHRKYPPIAFTEHGAIMAATILSTPRAIQMSVYVVRAFARLRQIAAAHSKLAQELEDLRHTVAALDADTRRQFDQVYEAILGLMATSPRRQ